MVSFVVGIIMGFNFKQFQYLIIKAINSCLALTINIIAVIHFRIIHCFDYLVVVILLKLEAIKDVNNMD